MVFYFVDHIVNPSLTILICIDLFYTLLKYWKSFCFSSDRPSTKDDLT